MHLTRQYRIALLVILVGMAFVPLLGESYMTYLVTQALIFGIFALSYDLLYGFTGMVSFGHSVFYGVPAYVMGMISVTIFDFHNPLLLVGAAMLSGIVLGCLIGFVCTFSRGIYMALITFAFAQIFWLLVLSDPWGVTFGENGIMGVRGAPMDIGGSKIELLTGPGLYYIALAAIVISYLIISRLMNSPLGDIFKGIKQNEARLLSLGYNPRPYKILAFGLSAMFASLAGAMAAFLNNSVVPSMVDWHIGAEILLITIMGGAGTLLGPIFAAFLIVFAESYASAYIGGGNWVYLMGGLFIAVVMFLPGGIFNTTLVRRIFVRR